MKIKVLTPFRFAEDGITVRQYSRGEYEVSKRVGRIAVAQGWARRTGFRLPRLTLRKAK